MLPCQPGSYIPVIIFNKTPLWNISKYTFLSPDRRFSFCLFFYFVTASPDLASHHLYFPPFPSLRRGLMHRARRSGRPTLPVASGARGTAGWPRATRYRQSRLEPLHVAPLLRQLYFTSVCRRRAANPAVPSPLKHSAGV